MKHLLRLTCTIPPALVLAGTSALPALADVTAEDVLANLSAPVKALGGTITAETTRDGDRLIVGETIYGFTLPFDLGDVRLSSSGMTLLEKSDGTVDILYDEPITGRLVVSGIEGELASATLTMSGMTGATVATGAPGDIKYAYALDRAEMALSDITVPDDPELSVEMTGTMEGSSGTYRITEGDLVTITAESQNGTLTYAMSMSDSNGFKDEGVQTVTGGTSSATIAIPAGKVSLTNLSQALRDGLALSLTGSGSRIDVDGTSTMGGEFASSQKYGYLMDTISYQLDASGIAASGRNSDISMEFLFGPAFPMLIKAEADAAEGRLKMPLNKTDGPADASLGMEISALRLDEMLWGMMDPGGQLPHDPANLTLDLDGQIEVLSDLLDIEALMAMGPEDGAPVLLHALTLNKLAFDAVGSSLDATGAFTFDNSDMVTFDGMPAPEGVMDITASGVDVLLDTLVAMGFVPEQEMAGARAMLSVVAAPGEQDGSYVSRIEVMPDGQVLANGKRLR